MDLTTSETTRTGDRVAEQIVGARLSAVSRRRFELDPERSRVLIEGSSSVHPIRARAKGLRGWVELAITNGAIDPDTVVDGEVRIALDRLRSGNALVDRETRRRVDAGRYPEIVGKVTASRPRSKGGVDLDGEIDFRGTAVAVSGTIEMTLDGDGDEVRLSGRQTFDVRDWGLQLPRLGFLRVHPNVEVSFEAVGALEPVRR